MPLPRASQRATGRPLERVSAQLGRLRALAGVDWYARVESANNFPSDAGIASSAAAFAALTLAGVAALGLDLDERELSLWTRRSGSGSACRSIPTGYAEWRVPDGPFDAQQWDAQSYAFSLASPEHWALADVVAVVDAGVKKIGSAENHQLAATSTYFPTRLAELPARLAATRDAIARRDLELLGAIHGGRRGVHACGLYDVAPTLVLLEQRNDDGDSRRARMARCRPILLLHNRCRIECACDLRCA